MENILLVLNIILAAILVILVLLQKSEGGALGIGVGDRVLMMQYTWYSVISPESCSSILWRTWDKKELAADALKLSSEDMLNNGLIDGIIKEPMGGAHHDIEMAYSTLKAAIKKELKILVTIPNDELVMQRIEKFSKMGVVVEPTATED